VNPDTGNRAEQVVHDARAEVAAGREPDWAELEARIRAAGLDAAATDRALSQLRRVATVARARASLAAPRVAPPPRRRVQPVARPTLTGNLDVGRELRDDAHVLTWPADPTVAAWEVRISERADPRSPYEVRDERQLPGDATSVDLPVDGGVLRVHVLGRSRAGRLVRRAMISGLGRDNWATRFERRASAS
jgi:hypothetical protein